MFEVSHTRKLVFAISSLFFVLVLVPLLVSWWQRRATTPVDETRQFYNQVGESLDRRTTEDKTTPVEMREEKEEYYTDVSRKLDRRIAQ